MIRSLQFHWLFSRNRFAQAMACTESGRIPRNARELYACYRLGLYETVANSLRYNDNWRGSFASAVSLAACGREKDAEVLVRSLVSQNKLGTYQIALADALAPFSPALAQELIAHGVAPAPLRAALLLRLERSSEAEGVIRDAIGRGEALRQPELHLFLSTAERPSPLQQLKYLNAFLASYGLSPLTLRDEAMSPGPVNIKSAEIPGVTGGPLVSVLMTAFRAGRRIEAAIDSLLAQTYRNIEVIVADDASDDDTEKVVKAIAARDSRVIYLRLPRNVGTYVAKSMGLRHASGEFVTCQDSDDWAHPTKIERQVRPLLEDQKLVFTTSLWMRMQDDGVYYARPVHPLMRLNPASPMFRKDLVLKQAGGWDAVRTGADSEFAARLRLVFGRRAMHRVAAPLTLGSHRPDSLMNAAGTGYSASGISPTRLAYWEGWGHFHINELRAGRTPHVPVDLLAERRFSAPEAIVVPREDIEVCLGACGG